MNEEEILETEVTEEAVTENVEQTTEETPQLFTREQMEAHANEVAGKRAARVEAKVRREFERKYGRLEEVLKAGTGEESLERVTASMEDFYKGKGVTMPHSGYSQRDLQILANADAQEIIDAGDEEVAEEMERLGKMGIANMSDRDKIVYRALGEHRTTAERGKALAEIGVPESVYNSKEFKAFAKQFQVDVPITKVYQMYESATGTEKPEPIGSMKNKGRPEEKTYYSPEDYDKLTPEERKNPVIMRRVRESMYRWK